LFGLYLAEIRRCGQAGEATDAGDVVLPLGDADGAAGFEKIAEVQVSECDPDLPSGQPELLDYLHHH